MNSSVFLGEPLSTILNILQRYFTSNTVKWPVNAHMAVSICETLTQNGGGGGGGGICLVQATPVQIRLASLCRTSGQSWVVGSRSAWAFPRYFMVVALRRRSKLKPAAKHTDQKSVQWS